MGGRIGRQREVEERERERERKREKRSQYFFYIKMGLWYGTTEKLGLILW